MMNFGNSSRKGLMFEVSGRSDHRYLYNNFTPYAGQVPWSEIGDGYLLGGTGSFYQSFLAEIYSGATSSLHYSVARNSAQYDSSDYRDLTNYTSSVSDVKNFVSSGGSYFSYMANS
jgi:hypothetical protein